MPRFRAHVVAEGLDAEALTGPSDNSAEFRLCRTLGDHCLRLGQGLDAMLVDADAVT